MNSFYKCALDNKEYLINKVSNYSKQFIDKDCVIDNNFLEKYINCIIKYIYEDTNLEEILIWTRTYVFYEGEQSGFNLIFILKSLKKSIFELIIKNKNTIENTEDIYLLLYNVFENMETLIITEIKNLNKKINTFNKSSKYIDSALFLIKDGIIVHINSKMEQSSGYKKHELQGIKCWELIDSEFKEFIREKVINCNGMKLNKLYDTKIKVIDKSGKSKWVNLNVSRVSIGKNYYIIGRYNDFSKVYVDKNKYEMIHNKHDKSKLLNDFFSNISHELRTPINVMLAGIQTLNFLINNTGDLNIYREKIKTYLSIMNKNSLRMTRLVNNLMDMIQIKCGNYTINLSNRNVVMLMRDILNHVEKYAKMKSIDIQFESFKNEVIVACDRRKIEKALLKILSNAIKFTPSDGKIYISIFQSHNNIVISIKDNGIGIPRDEFNNIFKEFTKVDKSLSRETEGIGIGLSIAKGLINMQGGDILLKSELGKGSDFKIILPNKKLNIDASILDDCIEPFGGEKVEIEFSDIYI